MAATNSRKASAEEARVVLLAQPLVGLTKAAELLGIKAPNVRRLLVSGRLVGIPVEGAANVYLRSEVVALGRALKRERAKREATA